MSFVRLPTVTLANPAGKRAIVNADRYDRIEFWRSKGYRVVSETRGDDAPAQDPLAPIFAADEAEAPQDPTSPSEPLLSPQPRRGRRGA
jgi:hypothetical protein